MDRAELERLDRTSLIAQAEALGVARANILTRPELVDELLVRTAKKDDRDLPRARGFFGRARDLVAKVIEKGLHLPDAAERLRQVTVTVKESASRLAAPAVVPTVTLAEIYAAQGHRSRAIDTLRRVLELEPDHGAAESLLTTLLAVPSDLPPLAPPLSPPARDEDEEEQQQHDRDESKAPLPEPSAPTDETPAVSTTPRTGGRSSRRDPVAFLDDDPLPIRYDVDECVAIAVDPATLYVYWEVKESTLLHLRRTRPEGALCLRLLVITPSWDGPRSSTRDFDVDAAIANRVVRDLPAGAVVRAAIGFRSGDAFLAIAHAPALETPPGAPCPAAAESFVRWTPRGLAPVTALDSDYASIGRALAQLPPRSDAFYGLSPAPFGSSELSAGFRPNEKAEAPAQRPGLPSSDGMI